MSINMTPKELPPDFKNTFIRHLNIFNVIGIDILLNDDTKRGVIKKHGKFIFFTIAFTILMVFQIVFVVTSEKNGVTFEELANAIPAAVVFVQDVMLLIVLVYRRKEIRELIFETAKIWPNEVDVEQEQGDTLKNWLRRLKLFENLYFKGSVIGGIGFISIPILLTVYILLSSQQLVYLFPFNIYAPFKVDSVTRYVAKYAFESIFGFSLHICTHVSTILLLAALTVDISALMRLLQYDLENIVQARSLNLRGYGDTSEHHRKIECAVKTHQQLLRLTAKLNTIFGPFVLVPALLSSIILCFYGFITITSDRVQMMRNSIVVFGVFFEIFNLSWPGQLLADTDLVVFFFNPWDEMHPFLMRYFGHQTIRYSSMQSSDIAAAAYGSLWYDSDMKYRKMILTIITRSQKPCYISAMGYTNMTLNTFAKILSSSWSYLSLLSKVYQKNSEA